MRRLMNMTRDLYNAIYARNSEEAVRLIHTGKGDNTYWHEKCGKTPLIIAANNGMEDVVEAILTGPIYVNNIDHKGKDGSTALYAACDRLHEKVAKFLLERGAKNEADSAGETPLMRAASRGLFDVVATMLTMEDFISNINAQGANGNTALYWACVGGRADIAKLLIEKGATNVANNKGETPLMKAMAHAHMTEVVQLMLDTPNCVTNINEKTQDGNTALHVACANKHIDITKLLLKKGTTNVINKSGETPLLKAVMATEDDKEALQIVKLMLQKQRFVKDINMKYNSETLLYKACSELDENIAKLLIEYGADNTPDKDGWTPLMKAALRGMSEVVQLILNKTECDIDATNKNDHSALYWSCFNKAIDNSATKLLATYGADISHKTLDKNALIQTLREYQNSTRKSDLTDDNYWIAMTNKLTQKDATSPVDTLVGKNKRYDMAAQALEARKIFEHDEKDSQNTHGICHNKAIAYIANTFIKPSIKNKLLMNSIDFYKDNRYHEYTLNKKLFNAIKDFDGLSKDNLELIKMGDNITHDNFIRYAKDNEYSKHVYYMIMNRIATDRADGIEAFGKFFDVFSKEDEMFNFAEYGRNFAKSQGQDGFGMVKHLCITCDNQQKDIFENVKELYDDMKYFKCVRNCYEYELFLTWMEVEHEARDEWIQEWHEYHNAQDFDHLDEFVMFVKAMGLGGIVDCNDFDGVTADFFMNSLYDFVA